MDIVMQEQYWREQTEKSISSIKNYLSLKEDYAQDFVKLAQFIMENDANPYSYMPTGFENSKNNAQYFDAFLQILHHAMVDDGDYIFVSTKTHGPILLFASMHDSEYLEQAVQSRFRFSHSVEYTTHHDVQRFISELNLYNMPKKPLPIKR